LIASDIAASGGTLTIWCPFVSRIARTVIVVSLKPIRASFKDGLIFEFQTTNWRRFWLRVIPCFVLLFWAVRLLTGT
jgi:hypothetical protein